MYQRRTHKLRSLKDAPVLADQQGSTRINIHSSRQTLEAVERTYQERWSTWTNIEKERESGNSVLSVSLDDNDDDCSWWWFRRIWILFWCTWRYTVLTQMLELSDLISVLGEITERDIQDMFSEETNLRPPGKKGRLLLLVWHYRCV